MAGRHELLLLADLRGDVVAQARTIAMRSDCQQAAAGGYRQSARTRRSRPAASEGAESQGGTIRMTETMPESLKTYDRVRVAAIRDEQFATLPIHNRRHPEVGDVAVIVDMASRQGRKLAGS